MVNTKDMPDVVYREKQLDDVKEVIRNKFLEVYFSMYNTVDEAGADVEFHSRNFWDGYSQALTNAYFAIYGEVLPCVVVDEDTIPDKPEEGMPF